VVDVFGSEPYRGNPLAVVVDGKGLSTKQMQEFARWTNLSETTFLLEPGDPAADYTVRIFTTDEELPFAGHPTLGSCRAWLEHLRPGATPPERIVQHCGAGLVEIRRNAAGLAFVAPPLVRSGPVDTEDLARFAGQLGVGAGEIVDASWVDNGPGWVAVLLADAASVLALRPRAIEQKIGAVGPYPPGSEAAFEVRAFCPWKGSVVEDPVTGSLNASLAQWLTSASRATAPYVASQGTVLGRSGRVQITEEGGEIWVGGSATVCVRGTVEL
jgi:PhzF family phenazine biosynthesis protein